MGDTRKKDIDQTNTNIKDKFIVISKFKLINCNKDSCVVNRLLLVFPEPFIADLQFQESLHFANEKFIHLSFPIWPTILPIHV